MTETPLRSALLELARVMEILDENSAAAVEYRVRYLVDLKKRVDAGVANETDNFFDEAKKLQEALAQAPEAIKNIALHTVLGMMHARTLAEQSAAKEIADLKQRIRDLEQRGY